MFRSAMLLRSCTACFCFYVMSAGMAPLAAGAQEAAAPDTQSPLEPLPGLGVAWPDMDKPDEVAPLEPEEEESTTAIEETGGDAVEAPITIDTASVPSVDYTSEQKYKVVLRGLNDVFDDQFRDRFDQLSVRSEEHTSELQSLMRISYSV